MAAALAACAPTALVRATRAPGRPVLRVALAPVRDYPGAPGSGTLAAGAFARALSRAGYTVVRRWDQADAVAYADLTEFSQAAPRDVRVFSPAEPSPAPLHGLAVTGDAGRVVLDFALAMRSPSAPFTWVAKWASARVALRVRVVDAVTGDEVALAWAANRPSRFQAALDYTYHQTADAAAEQASDALAAALARAGAPSSQIVTGAAK